MTCIAALVHEGKVYMAADSAGVAGYSLTRRADEKVFRNGPFVMGFTSSFRMGQLLRYSFKPPRRHPDDDIMKFMVNDFVDGVRKCLKDGGFATTKDEAEIAGTFLVGYQGQLFKIEGDYQVGRSLEKFAACGCGEDLALGALHATRNAELHPAIRLKRALSAAAAFSAGVAAPFMVVSA